MGILYRIRTSLTGFVGGPGVATMYSLTQPGAVSSYHTFWAAVATIMPSAVKINIEPGGDIIEETDGALSGSWVGAATTEVVGGDSGRYAGGTGALVGWRTASVLGKHRVQGRTFIVPVLGVAFDNDGTLGSGQIGVLQAAANALIQTEGGNLVIWHRPRKARAAVGALPAVTAAAGGHAVVTSARIPDRAAILRSRRD